MIKTFLHKFGKHSWKYQLNAYLVDRRVCSVCNKVQIRRRVQYDPLDYRNEDFCIPEWENLNTNETYVRS